jgi:hypothetical protein
MAEPTRIVGGIQIVDAQRSNGRHRSDVVSLVVRRVAGQHDDAAGRIPPQRFIVELIAKPMLNTPAMTV